MALPSQGDKNRRDNGSARRRPKVSRSIDGLVSDYAVITDVVKQTGIKIGEKTLTTALKKLPGNVLIKINQRIGFRLLTKFGEKGAINLARLPVHAYHALDRITPLLSC